ncbi:MAG: hypothetical protein IK025_12400 [Bacteroidales bacterium]|nr:hypothetical protein [Bacteroidales bacterium]
MPSSSFRQICQDVSLAPSVHVSVALLTSMSDTVKFVGTGQIGVVVNDTLLVQLLYVSTSQFARTLTVYVVSGVSPDNS